MFLSPLQKNRGVPVFVMLPLDTVNNEGVFKYATSPWFAQSLHLLGNSGVYGVAIDVWWGAVERGPGQYLWSGYKQLFETVKQTGLKLQVVFSFHACGDNVGDTAHVPLPSWVLRCGDSDPDLFFTDRPRGGCPGQRNREYLSVWADEAPAALSGRSPMQCYEDFMMAFRDAFNQDLGTTIEELVVGAGPCGELRFPSYVEANGWRFPGVGEFQCYDRRALASLAEAAREAGHAEWGFGGPHDTGDYNSNPEETGFYNHEGSWDSSYGRFFLDWYSGSLIKHGERLLSAARRVFGPSGSATQPQANSSGPSSERHSSDASGETNHPEQHPISHLPLGSLHLGRSGGSGAPVSEMDTSSAGGTGGPQSVASGAFETEQSEGSMSVIAEVENFIGSHCSNSRNLSSGRVSTEAIREDVFGPCIQPAYLDSREISAEDPLAYASADSVAPTAVDDSTKHQRTDEGDGLRITTGATCGTSSGGPDESNQAALSRGAGIRKPSLTLKIAGIHWWFRSRSHAAELTAGYYNTATRDGYAIIVDLCAKHSFGLTLTCVEMCDNQHPPPAQCGPEGLLKQMRSLCAQKGVPLSGENALPIFQTGGVDTTALDRIVFNTRAWHGAVTTAGQWGSLHNPSLGHQLQSPDYNSQGRAGCGLYRHTIHPSVGNVSMYNDRASADFGAAASETASPSLSSGGGSGRQLWSARSDPAIAATGLRADSYADIPDPLPAMRSFTFLRLGPEILQASYQTPWMKFMWKMREAGYY